MLRLRNYDDLFVQRKLPKIKYGALLIHQCTSACLRLSEIVCIRRTKPQRAVIVESRIASKDLYIRVINMSTNKPSIIR